MMKTDEFDLNFDTFEDSINEKEQQSALRQTLDLLPDGEQDPDVQLAIYDNLIQKSLSEELRKGKSDEDISLAARDIYRRELAKVAPLSPEQELIVARKAKAGDAEAQRILVESNLRLVPFLVRYWLYSGCDFEDLCQEGNLGLIQAAERYDPDKGYKFSTYAVWWIKKNITNYISSQGHTLPVPPAGHRDISLIKKTVEAFAEKNAGNTPTLEEISSLLGLSQARIKSLMGASTAPLSIDSPNPLKNGASLQDVIPDSRDTYPNPMKSAEYNALFEVIQKAMGELFTKKEQHILELRFGFLDGRKYTLQQIGDEFGVSRQRMYVIERKLLAKLKDSPFWPVLREFNPDE